MTINLNKYIKYLFLFTIIAFSLSSCEFSAIEEPTQIVDFQDDLTLELVQKLNAENEYYWLVSTNESNFCKESQLITEYIDDKEFDVLIIHGLDTPNDCSSNNAKIWSLEEMNLDRDELSLVINIANKVTYSTKLKKTENIISIEAENSDAFTIRETFLQKVDKKHLWGGLMNPTEQNKALFFDLYQKISNEIIYEQVEQGNHGYFSYSNSNLRVIDPVNYLDSDVGFAIKIEEDFNFDKAIVENFVLDFRMQHPEIDFFISLGDGQQF